MRIGRLDDVQSSAFINEVTAARNLLAYGVRAMERAPHWDTTRDPVLSLLSIGVEKLYKLSIGVMVLQAEGHWPTRGAMRAHGHNVRGMHDYLMAQLRTRAEGESHYVSRLLDAMDNDSVVLPVMDALDAYGQGGRFYFLDVLAGEKPEPHPTAAIDRIESAAQRDPEVAALYGRAMADCGDSAAWDRYRKALQKRIATAVMRVWDVIAVAGQHGLMGVEGKYLGCDVAHRNVGRQE